MSTIIPQLIIGTTDLAAAFLFLYGLKRMSSPGTAPSGIFVAGLGMVVAILASFLYVFSVSAAARPHLAVNVGLALIALALGGGVAWWSGKKVALTAMPQMVALYNGMGGGAAGAIAAVELFGNKAHGACSTRRHIAGRLIGAVSLSGSVIAWAKLDGVIKKPLRVKGQQAFNALFMLATLAVGGYIVFVTRAALHPLIPMPQLIYLFFGCALVFGVLMTLPIGGADMPVVISIYNADRTCGRTRRLRSQNPALMIAGMVVGAAGTLLTLLMAKAMNRSVKMSCSRISATSARHKAGNIKGSLKPSKRAMPASSCATPARSSSCRATALPSPRAAETL
jgi:H+-translocating NAD(P) transhydrogenase subunit beta